MPYFAISSPVCLRSRRLLLFAAVLFVFSGSALLAQTKPRLVAPKQAKAKVSPAAVSGCPDQGGLLDSVIVPVAESLDLAVFIGRPAPRGGLSFQVSSQNPAFVAAGDRRQGFLPVVTVPEGEDTSNLFTLFGIGVGQTRLTLINLTQGGSSTFPLGAWDVNKSGAGSDQKILDANDPVKMCRDAGSSSLTSNPSVLATCGREVKGVAADGTNALVLRTVSGLAGTSCFEIVSTSSGDQGAVETPLTSTQSVSSLNYGFSYYTPPKFYGDSSDSREVTVEFTFTPNIGNGNTSRLRANFQIVRPPVVLIHGVWSNGGSWNDEYLRNDAGHTTYAGDYASTNASSFSTNASKVQDFIAQAIKTFRQKGFAGTQADIVGHSMGGLLTRLYAGSDTFKRPDNLDKGDIHRLVTLDTPHFGSNFANLLVALHRVNPAKTASTVSSLTGGTVVNGAVCDLSENSPALNGLSGGTSLPGQFITATGGPAGTPASPAPYWGGATFLGLKSFESALKEQYCTRWTVVPRVGPVCTQYAYYFPQVTVDAFRFREQNDAVVPLSSEQGGLAGINFTDYIHFHIPAIPGVQRGITDGADVAARVFQLLDGPESGFASALPAVQSNGTGAPKTVPGRGNALDRADYVNQCAAGGPMKPASASRKVSANISPAAFSPNIRIVSPAPGTVFAHGETLNVLIELSAPLTVENTVAAELAGLTNLGATWTSGLRFTATINVPPLVTGPLAMTPNYTDTAGNFFTGTPITIGVKPATLPVSAGFHQDYFSKSPGGPPEQLYFRGTYADGSVHDLTSSFTGTTYSSSDTRVATVSADGSVQIRGSGFATITAVNGPASDQASFLVEATGAPMPPVNLTAQMSITRSGFRLDRSSGFFVQDITVRNLSGAPVPASLQLVFGGLTAGVTLINKSGQTTAAEPIGASFVTLPLPGDGLTLPAGASVKFTARFLNAGRAAISYTPSVYRSSGTP